jgi:hypothetical protein
MRSAAHVLFGSASLGGSSPGWRRIGADMVMLRPTYRIPSLENHATTLRRFKEVASG